MNSSIVFRDFVEEFRERLEINVSECSELFNMSKRSYIQFLDKPVMITGTSIVSFSLNTNLNIDSLFDGQADVETAVNHYKGEVDFIPRSYFKGAESKVRTLNIILDYIKKTWGPGEFDNIVQYLQIPHSFLKNNDQKISINVLNIALDYFEKRRFGNQEFYMMGADSYSTIKKTKAGKLLRSLKSPKKLIEGFILDLMPYFEANCDYKILALNNSRCIFQAKSREEVIESTGLKVLSSMNLDKYKLGVLSSLAKNIDLDHFVVSKPNCEHAGYDATVFSVNFE